MGAQKVESVGVFLNLVSALHRAGSPVITLLIAEITGIYFTHATSTDNSVI